MEVKARKYCSGQGLKAGSDEYDNCVYGTMHNMGWKGPKKKHVSLKKKVKK